MQLFFVSSGVRAVVTTLLLLATIQIGFAQVRSSSNYQIQSDSLNVGGGISSSTNFIQESTVGEIATGNSTSTNYELRAGYQQMQEVFISLTGAADIVMDSIPGLTGGVSNGTSTLVVTTDSPSGYSLSIEASDSPAMQGPSGSIDDYPHGANPDFSFGTADAEAHFGYTPSGTDIVEYFQDSGGLCNNGAGGDTSFACWAGLSTTSRIVAESTSSNHPTGVTTTINFRVGVGSTAGVLAGLYTATTTVTALPL